MAAIIAAVIVVYRDAAGGYFSRTTSNGWPAP